MREQTVNQRKHKPVSNFFHDSLGESDGYKPVLVDAQLKDTQGKASTDR